MKKSKIQTILFLLIATTFMYVNCQSTKSKTSKKTKMSTKPIIEKSVAEWKKILTDEEYHVLREAGTERAFTGKYTDTKDDGNYYCKACGNLLFTSETKYHSGCGWPAFYDNAGESAVEMRVDNSYGMSRVEVICKKCHSHLGHIFEDGPRNKTGMRYCINSISIDFKKDSSKDK